LHVAVGPETCKERSVDGEHRVFVKRRSCSCSQSRSCQDWPDESCLHRSRRKDCIK